MQTDLPDSTRLAAIPTEPSLVDGVALYPAGPDPTDGRPPLVLVHGGMHAAWVWADVQAHLAARGRRSIAFDWYSHGRSRTLPVEAWADRSLTAVAHEIGVACAAVDDGGAPPVVVAHSMGGLAALAFAAARPERLGGLVLLAPVVPHRFGGEPIPVPGLDPRAPYGPFPPPVARELFYDGLDETAARRWIRQLQPESPTAVVEAVRWTGQVDVSGIAAPMLVVGAELDRLVPPASVRALADATGAGYVQLPATGHGIPVNPGWEHVLDLVTAWIELVRAR